MAKRILMSVTDKTGIEKFEALVRFGWEIISTGGTAKRLQELGIPYTPIEKITSFPEMLDGRLKTLHPKVFGGILANRSKADHMTAIAEHGIGEIDVVVVNLYEFEKKPGIENIDIGGPSLIRAAAKNGASITVLTDPEDYDYVISQIVEDGSASLINREVLAIKVFKLTSWYDAQIAEWMQKKLETGGLFNDSEFIAGH